MSGTGVVKASDVKGSTAYDEILRAWLSHSVEKLTQEHARMLVRWEDVHRLIRQGELIKVEGNDKIKRYNFSQLVEWLREQHQISARQAYDDIKNARRFFALCEGREDLEHARGGSIEVGEMMMWAAHEAGDRMAALGFYKETNKVRGFHEITPDLPDYESFVPPTYVIVSDPTELGFERVENVEEVVKRILHEKRSGFLEDEAQDAEEVE